MKLDLTDMLYALSFSLDKVEASLLGIDTGHGKRVAYLSLLMAKEVGLSGEELRDFVGCCILHDNALTEFIYEELAHSVTRADLPEQASQLTDVQKKDMTHYHCIVGEKNIRLLPFHTDIRDIVLYHHETANGTGALKRTAAETTLKSQILHLADIIDVSNRLYQLTREEFEAIRQRVQRQAGTIFSERAAEAFLNGVTFEDLDYLKDHDVLSYLHQELHKEVCEYTPEEIHNVADLFAAIVDYKSAFTQSHSRGVAAKAEQMAYYYGFDTEKATRFYFAGAMHDIGKLMVSNDILEKPGKLTEDEFAQMKNHAAATHYILHQIKEIPDIVKWASNHHEKLNGRGYPQGLTADELSFEERLMACIDIYQALTEVRPYKDGMPHEKAISIMMGMAQKGEIDETIVQDMSIAMAPKERFGDEKLLA